MFTLTVQKYTFNPFQTNTFICHDQGEAVIVDASAFGEQDIDLMAKYINDNNLTVKHLLLTHAHIDHILGCAALASRFNMAWRLHASDMPFIARSSDQARLFGIEMDDSQISTEPIKEGDVISFGSVEWSTILTPGHSPGSVSFVDQQNKIVVAGDVLFQGSIGRTDLWQGSLPELMRSIYEKLLPLGDDFQVFCGHGPNTTIGDERRTNPFLQEDQ